MSLLSWAMAWTGSEEFNINVSNESRGVARTRCERLDPPWTLETATASGVSCLRSCGAVTKWQNHVWLCETTSPVTGDTAMKPDPIWKMHVVLSLHLPLLELNRGSEACDGSPSPRLRVYSSLLLLAPSRSSSLRVSLSLCPSISSAVYHNHITSVWWSTLKAYYVSHTHTGMRST